jgi:hypothetical protein
MLQTNVNIDTAVLTKGTDFQEAAVKAQKALLDITNWTKEMDNQAKSAKVSTHQFHL